MNKSAPLRIVQLSDTHFLEDGAEAEGGFAYNTAEAFDAVRDHLAQDAPADLVVVTGDVADHGRPAQYAKAGEAFSQLGTPVNVCPGNHDQDAAFTATLARPSVGTSRAIEMDNWCFLFVDSNSGAMVSDEQGRLIDPPNYDDRLHGNGALGQREAGWVRDMCAATGAEHVFVWLHHPPAATLALVRDDAYTEEWAAVVSDLDKLRGFGGGHTHVPREYPFGDVPVFVCPALKNNFDMDAETLLPPGYRTYEFAADGSVSSEVQLVDDPRWPRHPLGRAAMSLMRGELTWTEFEAIVARKTATLD